MRTQAVVAASIPGNEPTLKRHNQIACLPRLTRVGRPGDVAGVLRPGGRIGLVWNVRDERLGWVKDLATHPALVNTMGLAPP